MKKLTYILFLIYNLIFLTCSKDCGECSTFADPFRISIIDSTGNNRLDTISNNKLEIDKIIFKTGEFLEFKLTNLIDGDFPVNYFYINSIDNNHFNNCLQQDCEMYIYYKNLNDIDTINTFIDHVITTKPDGCKCEFYPTLYYKFNGLKITKFEIEHETGAALIVKN